MKVTIILGSIRKGRQSHKAAYYLERELQQRGIYTHLVDLSEEQLPVHETQTTQAEQLAETVHNISRRLQEADALLFVTPEYHGSFSGVLKNALDYFWVEFQKKPIGVVTVSTGKMGGINASTQLQHVILSLGAYPLPTKFLIAEVHEAFSESFEPVQEKTAKAGAKFLDEFLWFADAIQLKKASSQKKQTV